MERLTDGIAVRSPVPEALSMLEGCFDAVLSVSDDDIMRAMRLAAEHLALIAEPTGAVGLATILAMPARFRGQTVATILTGGNIATADFGSLFDGNSPIAE